MDHKPAGARYVWTTPAGRDRNAYAMFRRTFALGVVPQGSTTLSVFADTHYQLFVNGAFAGFGPIRFDPRYPRFDTHEIGPYLRKGENVVAVLVNSIQHVVFRTIPAGAGLVVWGKVHQPDGAIDFATGAVEWKAKDAAEYLNAPRMGFALNAGELVDQSRAALGWKEPGYDDSDWQPAVPVADQEAWGPLEPRNIPHMDGGPLKAAGATALPIIPCEDVHSHALDTPNLDTLPPAPREDAQGPVVCEGWVWSPVDQTVSVGVHWNDHWINGEKASGTRDIDPPNFRQQQTWTLRAGWNHYMGAKGPQGPVMQHYIGLPKGLGLVLSADRNKDSAVVLRRIRPSAETAAYMRENPLPWAPGADVPGGWEDVGPDDAAQNPCLEYSWDNYGNPVESPKPEELENGWLFRKSLYPNGFCLLIDMGRMRLFHPTLTLTGAKGAKVDMVYGEQFLGDGRHIRILPWVPLGDRALVSEDSMEWTTCHVRGTRYLAITVRDTVGDVGLKVAFRSASYPVGRKGSFACSDPALTRIWELCRNTQEANMEDAYVDCSGRERGLYIRDAIIQYHNNLAFFGDHDLFRRCMELIGQSPDGTRKFRAVYPNTGTYTIADFALNAVEGFQALYDHSGDASVADAYWPAIMANLDWFHELSDERGDALLNGTWDKARGVKEPYGGFHGDNSLTPDMMDKEGPHSAFTCTYLMSMRSAERLATVLGKGSDASGLRQRIAKLEEEIPKAFWDSERNCFTDTLARKTWSLHANVMAVNAGVATPVMMEGIRAHIRRNVKSIFRNGYDPSGGVWFSPHYSFYVFDGLYRLGLSDIAQDTIRQGWGWMLSKGLNTCPEFFTLDNSLCHAWSASPAWYLGRNVLGVSYPKAPDMDEVEIRVDAPGIEWADGTFPHPRGVVRVKWHMESGRRVFDTLEVPEGCMVAIRG